MNHASLLATVGARVRARRESRGLTRRALSEGSGVSERFLAELEGGRGNISLVRFAQVAGALGVSPAELLDGAGEEPRRAHGAVALLGVRGAGKSSVGRALARRLGVPFVELDRKIEESAGLSLAEIFELHGEAHYRRLEREALREVLDGSPLVLATGGSIVSDATAYGFLRDHARTVWLRARPEDHWERVIEQGDRRPMAENPHAYAQLRSLLATREPLYARAHLVVKTSGRSVPQVADDVLAALA